MKPIFLLLVSIFILQSCGTLINTTTTRIEIVVPPKIQFPANYKNVALRYNNCNMAYNPNLAVYAEGQTIKTDAINIDSIASIIYFDSFVENLNNQIQFDTIHILTQGDYSDVIVSDTFKLPEDNLYHYSISEYTPDYPVKPVWVLSDLLQKVKSDSIPNNKTEFLNPKLGLYAEDDLKHIRDTTHTDLLFSFDFFCTFNQYLYEGTAGYYVVYLYPFWNIYDLQRQEIIFHYFKEDTLYWESANINNINTALSQLTSREEAIYNSAAISANVFAELIAPYWLEVERIYYKSWNKEMRNAEKLLRQNKWLEAAEIWQKNSKNKNKIIAAKSMYNLGLACEMEGQMDAAIDWLVKSHEVFKNKNEDHYYNCVNYINILGQRKLDIRSLETPLSLSGN